MKKTNLKGFWLTLICLVYASTGFCQHSKPVHIYLVGGAVMADKPKQQHPEMGWGTRMNDFFDSTVVVSNKGSNFNLAISADGELFKSIIDSIQKGDYVLIEPEGNLKPNGGEAALADKGFQRNLQQMITKLKEKQAITVLVTPPASRKFNPEGKIVPQSLALNLVLQKTAQKNSVLFIDLTKQSAALIAQFGPEDSKRLFNYLEADQNPNYLQGRQDDVHFNEFGARKVAQIILKDLREAFPDLKSRVVKSNWSK